jgi:hypothetical protein
MVGFYEIYTGMTIASSILYALGIWILLFVVVYRLNIMLREHLGSLTKEHKVGSLIITAVLLIITIVQFSLHSCLDGIERSIYAPFSNWCKKSWLRRMYCIW